MAGAVGVMMVVGFIMAFLPFISALSGKGAIWKLLTLVFCLLALFGAITIIGGILAWCVAWVFAALARQAGHTDRAERRFRKQLLNEKSARYNDRELMRNIRR